MTKITLNKKYKSLFKDDSTYFICTGGRNSAKSFSISTWLAMLIMVESNHTILFTRFTMSSANISIIPEFVEKLELLGISKDFEITKDSIINKTTGSKILFRGIKTSNGDQTANLKSLKGITTWIMDEAEELMDESIFDKIRLSVRSKLRQNRIILILNPTSKTHWIYERFFQKKGVESGFNGKVGNTTYIHTTYLDNLKYIPGDYVLEVEELKETNPVKYKHVLLGHWLDIAEGVIFTNWKYGEFDETLPFGFAIDYGHNPDPTSFNKIAVDKKNKKIYVEEICYKTNMSMNDYINETAIAGTKEIIAEYAGQGSFLNDELRKAGRNITAAVKGPNSIIEGITLMQDYEIIITPSSTNIGRELNNYVWSNKKSGTPIDMYNHSIDSIRYYVTNQITKPTITKFRIY